MKYPYEEDAGGILRDRHKTGKASEALMADSQVASLATELLPSSLLSEAEGQSKLLVGSRTDKAKARAHLKGILGPRPKRPIYYIDREIDSLPHWTRNALRYLGDYVDLLVKSAVYGETKNDKVFESSLGPAITQFRKAFPRESKLADWLTRYNRFLYRDAKHDMRLPLGRTEHRFTSREVVLCLYITRELANRLVSLSSTAARANLDQHL